MSADMTSITNKVTSEIQSKLATSRLTCPQVYCRTKKRGSGSLRNRSASSAVEELQPQLTPNPQHPGVVIKMLYQHPAAVSCRCYIRQLVNFSSHLTIRIGFYSKTTGPQQTLTAYAKFSSGISHVVKHFSHCIKIFSSVISIIPGFGAA